MAPIPQHRPARDVLKTGSRGATFPAKRGSGVGRVWVVARIFLPRGAFFLSPRHFFRDRLPGYLDRLPRGSLPEAAYNLRKVDL